MTVRNTNPDEKLPKSKRVKKRVPLTDKLVERLIDMLEQGKTLQDLAKSAKVSVATINNWLRATRGPGKRLALAQARVGSVGKPLKKLTPEVLTKLHEALSIGMPARKAAALVKIGVGTYEKWIEKGLENPDSIYGELLDAIENAEAISMQYHLKVIHDEGELKTESTFLDVKSDEVQDESGEIIQSNIKRQRREQKGAGDKGASIRFLESRWPKEFGVRKLDLNATLDSELNLGGALNVKFVGEARGGVFTAAERAKMREEAAAQLAE